jgi:hypothetical protein
MNAANPDYDAGYEGDSIGGFWNIGHEGADVLWDAPSQLGTLGVGDVLGTPQGDYQVVDTGEGTVGLLPMDGAHKAPTINGYDVIWNVVTGDDQFGINPYTGDVWVQEAIYNPGDFNAGEMPYELQYNPANIGE